MHRLNQAKEKAPAQQSEGPFPGLGDLLGRLQLLCREWSLVNRNRGVTTIIPLLCKCWSCAVCAPLRKRWLKQDALDGRPDTFITLTHRPKPGQSADEAAQEIVRAWRVLRKEAIEREGLKELAFIAVFERHKSGHPHLHILARSRWISWEWASERWQELVGAPGVHIRRIRSKKKAVQYCAKYCSKACTPFEGCKRYWRSLDYLERPEDPGGEDRPSRGAWEVVKTYWWDLVKEYGDLGYWIELGPDSAEVGLHPP